MTSSFLEATPVHSPLNQNSLFISDLLSGTDFSFLDFYSKSDELAAELPRGLVILLAKNRLFFTTAYAAALRSHNPVLVLDSDISANALRLIVKAFEPAGIVSDNFDNPLSWKRKRLSLNGFFYKNPGHVEFEIYDQLATLMPTSGSTGSPKCVRVSYDNILTSTSAIGEFLQMRAGRKLITSLPLHYTYGLSLLHLAMLYGLPLVLTEKSALTDEFWNETIDNDVTYFSGVPVQYDFLIRRGIDSRALDQLACMTQAGGSLHSSKTRHFLELSQKHDFDFFTMYGQTEATPRISFVPPSIGLSKLGSVGMAIPGGKLSIESDSSHRSNDARQAGEVVYSGKNVCLGYARTFEDLSKGDELLGVLRTGDCGYLDEDGFLFLTGRLGREIKVSGKRVNLDSAQSSISHLDLDLALVGKEDLIVVLIVGEEVNEVRALLAKEASLHPSMIQVMQVEKIPRLSSGKVGYASLNDTFLNS